VDVLSGGRLRLGIGLGWNDVEYESLNEDFHTRGRRIEEQVQVLRRLWTEPIVDFEGKWHRIDRAGINPLPVRRPIPIFMGGLSDIVLERAARIADGWFPIIRDEEGVAKLPGQIKQLRERVASFGRPRESFEIRVQAGFTTTSPDEWAKEVESYREMGVDFLCFSTMGTGLETPRDHIAAMRRYKEALG
jgi:probable F420-dependent oxidoreductase